MPSLPLIRDLAFLLKSTDYGDQHRILSFLTERHGRVDMIALGAKNSQKRFSGLLDFGHMLQIEYQGQPRSQLPRLLYCELTLAFLKIRNSYERLMTSLSWYKLLARVLSHNQTSPEIFDLLRVHLAHLEFEVPEWVDLAFRHQLLAWLGYPLELSRCLDCGESEGREFRLILARGGLFCVACLERKRDVVTGDPFLPMPAKLWDFTTRELGYKEKMLETMKKCLQEAFGEFLEIKPKF